MNLREFADQQVERLIDDAHLRAWISPLVKKCMKTAFVAGWNRGKIHAMSDAVEQLELVIQVQAE